MKFIIAIGLILSASTFASGENKLSGLKISENFVRNVPPVFTVTAAYFKLVNNRKEAFKIVKSTSNCAKTVELHDVKEEDGATKMIHMPTVTVKPGETLHFKPHGKHIMLIGLTDDYHKDVPCKFSFETENKKQFSFTASRKKALK